MPGTAVPSKREIQVVPSPGRLRAGTEGGGANSARLRLAVRNSPEEHPFGQVSTENGAVAAFELGGMTSDSPAT